MNSSAARIEPRHGAESGIPLDLAFRLRREQVFGGAILAVILVAAGFLRFAGLDREGRWCDEYHQTLCYQSSPYYVVLTAQSDGQPPMDYLLGWALAKVSHSVWMMRAPAAFFGLCGVALCFLVVRRLANSWPVGLLAAAMLALSPLHWKLSQTARPYTIFVAAFLLMLLMLIRAIERPDRRRLAVFAATAYLMTLTRGLVPLVVLLATGIILVAACVATRGPRDAKRWAIYRNLRRVTLVTLAVGLAVLPLVAFLLLGDQGWTRFSADGGNVAKATDTTLLTQLMTNAVTWWRALPAMFGVGAVGVFALAVAGAAFQIARWRTLPPATQCVLGIFWLIGPLYLLVFTVSVRDWPMAERYALFMVPAGVMFAAMAAFTLARQLRLARIVGDAGAQAIGAALIVALLASPAWSTMRYTKQYFHADWRGAAAFLADKVSSDDVVMVIEDRPLGGYQPTFWGKHEWPKGFGRPLAESVWTLATSESHWARLLEKSGRSFIVILHPIVDQGRHDYLEHGLRVAPEGMKLAKFRGIDLLYHTEPVTDPISERLVACDMLLRLPLENPDAAAIPHTLRSRLLWARGDLAAATDSYQRALQWVPATRQSWFATATAPLAAAVAPRP